MATNKDKTAGNVINLPPWTPQPLSSIVVLPIPPTGGVIQNGEGILLVDPPPGVNPDGTIQE